MKKYPKPDGMTHAQYRRAMAMIRRYQQRQKLKRKLKKA